MVNHATMFQSITSTVFYVALCSMVLLLVREKEWRCRLSFTILSQLALAGPLIAVGPISERCFLITYLFFALFAAQLMLYIRSAVSVPALHYEKYIAIACSMIAVIVVMGHLSMQYKVHAILNQRSQRIEEGLEQGAETIVLPLLPNSANYCYGANPGPGDWVDTYKEFYAIPENIEVLFEWP
jgi:hypothetical protein